MIDKQTLLSKINQAKITPQLKSELLEMVNSSAVADEDLLTRINASIDSDSQNLIEEMANVELSLETDKYDKQMQAVGKDVDNFVKELNKKADEIDIQEARSQIN